MAELKKMFVHYTGTIADFEKLADKSSYDNSIVFIKGGADGTGSAIYTHGNFYANLEEANKALSQLKYLSGVKVGDTTISSTGPNGVLEIVAADPATVAISGDSTGVTIGLTEAFTGRVAQAETDIDNAEIAIGQEVADRKAAIQEVEGEVAKKADATTVSGIEGRVATIEEDYLKAADIEGKLDTATFNAQVSELTQADSTNLQTAKDYTDAEIAKLGAAAQAQQVAANKAAIKTLQGSDSDKSVREIAVEEVAKIINDNDDTSIDTLEEIAAWIAAHPDSVAAINKQITDLEKLVGTTSVESQINTKISGLNKTDNAVAGQYVSAVSETAGVITVTRETLPTYTLVEGTVNGTVKFNGTDIAVHGLKSAAYTESSAYDVAGAAAAVLGSDSDTKDKATVYGVKAHATDAATTAKNEAVDHANSLFEWEEL